MPSTVTALHKMKDTTSHKNCILRVVHNQKSLRSLFRSSSVDDGDISEIELQIWTKDIDIYC
eukprot:TRINITY_DN10363_c0_g1_i1.p2 TRINITY_DN10363_c0_g1~~TRINITY_DN10363_c0_g1_i1.p2  ORF type:complete len:62 (+),score=11.25 TRINITY_DN10363_c0_g1_i1:157-342(+)